MSDLPAPCAIRALTAADRGWLAEFLRAHWGSDSIVSRGIAHDAAQLPGFVAEAAGQVVGLLTYAINGDACEIVSLDSLREGLGIGAALITAAREQAQSVGCKRLWLITTNDNLHALRFYQRRGFTIAALHPNAIAESRRIKPEIPLLGNDGIPIRDEIELEMFL